MSPKCPNGWEAAKKADGGRDERIPAPARAPAKVGEGGGTPGKEGHVEAGRVVGEGALSSVVFCLSAPRCSSPFSLFLCVSLRLCVSLTLVLFFLRVPHSPSSPPSRLALSPHPSLMHIIEFSLDHGCPFLQLTLPPTEVLPICPKPGIPPAVSHLLPSPSRLTASGGAIKLSPLLNDNPLLSVALLIFLSTCTRVMSSLMRQPPPTRRSISLQNVL